MPAPSRSQTPSEYFFSNVEAIPEANRLHAQHRWLSQAFDHPQIAVPDCIDTSRVTRVLDVAAGTGIWATDFAEIPMIKERLSTPTHTPDASADPRMMGPVDIYACDIDLTKFGHNRAFVQLQDEGHVNLFQQDVLKPFPEDMRGTFDLVHAAMLIYVLKKEEWVKFLVNIRELLRPGGHLLLTEGDAIFYSPDSPPPHPTQEHDFARANSGGSTVSKMSKLFTQSSVNQGGYPDLSRRLPILFDSASFRIISSEILSIPVGRLCESMTSRRGSSMVGEKERSYHDAVHFLEACTSALIKKGPPDLLIGDRIETEEDRRVLMDVFKKEIWERGIIATFSEWVVQKV